MAIRIAPRKRNTEAMRKLARIAADKTPSNPGVMVERNARRIALMMSQIHGGTWQVLIDHQRRAVMVWEQ